MIILEIKVKFSCFTHLYAMKKLIQLACVKYTASVHPEPGSNSLFLQIYILINSD